jgi:uncharacterized protein (UPF0332 family)
MEGSALDFWKKSQENLTVSQNARDSGHLNAAASRYYYALVLAGLALFARKKIPVIWERHLDFIDKLSDLLDSEGCASCDDAYDALSDALAKRTRADYEPYPVKPRHLDAVVSKCATTLNAIKTALRC